MPETSSFVSRPGGDGCPGVLRLAEAADGFLARVRLPGGLVSGEQLRVLAGLADELGDGRVELTSRGNVQLRGLAADDAEALTDGLARAGLLPSLSHDRVRNVLASPLAGLDGRPDLSRIVRALDAALCARPRLAELSGRFLFAVDDGRGDVSGLGADVIATLHRNSPPANGTVVNDAGVNDTVVNDIVTNGTVTNGTVTNDTVTNGTVTNDTVTNHTMNEADVNGLLVRRPVDRHQDAPGHGTAAVRTGSASAKQGDASGTGDESGLGASAKVAPHPDFADADGLTAERGPKHHERVDGVVPDELQDAIVDAMLACAEAFLDLRAECGSTAWRIADLPDGADRVRAAAAGRLGLDVISREQPSHEPSRADGTDKPDTAGRVRRGDGDWAPPRGTSQAGATDGAGRSVTRPGSGAALVSRPVGLVAAGETGRDGESAAPVLRDRGDSVVLIAPLGRLTSAQLGWVADRLGGAVARVTPWRGIVVPWPTDAPRVLREAAGLGFGTHAGSPWLRVTACAGRPGCAKALADVQADAAGFAARWPGRIVHVSGCARHCGRPAATEIDVTATSEGYQVAGV